LVRDPTNSNNDLCQLGLNSTDQAALTSLITSFSTTMATQLFGTSSRRKRTTTVTANYTCSKLKQMGKGVIALAATQLAQIKQSEFVSCITSLGTITKWSTSQLSTLATLALTVKKIFIFNFMNTLIFPLIFRIMDRRLIWLQCH